MGPISARQLGIVLSIGASREDKGHGQEEVLGVIESVDDCQVMPLGICAYWFMPLGHRAYSVYALGQVWY